MSEKGIKITISCPKCKKSKDVLIPNFLFENKDSTFIKVNIDPGICCEHQFLIFVKKSGEIIGTESVDSVATLSDKNLKFQNLTLSNIIEKYGREITLLMLHSVIIERPIILISKESNIKQARILAKSLNIFFNKILPQNVKSPFLFSSLSGKEQKLTNSDSALVITPEGEVENIPWDSISLLFEEEMIDKALNMLDSSLQIEIMDQILEVFVEKCFFLNKKVQEWDRADRLYNRKIGNLRRTSRRKIYEDDIRDALRNKFPNEITKNEMPLFIQAMRSRFKVNIYKASG